MKPVVLAPVLAFVMALAGAWLGMRAATTPEAAAAPAAAVAPDSTTAADVAALAQRTAAIERGVEEIRLALADLRSERERRPVETARAPADDAGKASKPAAAAPVSAQDAFDALLAGEVDWDRAQELWKEVEKAGRLDELVKLLEDRAARRGDDPEAQNELGMAYLQKVFRAGAGPEAGVWAMKADRAFDAALALDDHHWMARFNKAVSLSFWPPVMGKQPDAVKHFELLIAQQEAGPKQEGYDETYLLLGNLYAQMGQADKAKALWQQGLALFPDSAGLLEKLK